MNQRSFSRAERVGPAIREVVCECFQRKIRDPRVDGLVITGVDMSPDLKTCRVYYVSSRAEADREALQRGVDSVSRMIRKQIGVQLNLRYTPQLVFRYDDSVDEARKIESLLDSVLTDPPAGESSSQ